MSSTLSKNIQIQGTNDSSIISKLSATNNGYVKDEYLKYFVEKPQKRSAIINRGYYIRFKAVESALEAWCSERLSSSHKCSQIISLGAGFDTSYFRLKSMNKLPSGCRYIEIDFPEVSRRKANCILKSSALKNLLNQNSKLQMQSDVQIILESPDYVSLGLDLKNLAALESVFKIIEVDYVLPTLLLSECAITYIETKNSTELILWVQKMFCNSAFAVYEQVHPEDGFGIVMNNHFDTIGSPLKSVMLYPNEKDQQERFLKSGWPECSILNIFDFFINLSTEEKIRIQSLELFDEYEMWHEKCQHYVLIWASQGMISTPDIFRVKDKFCLTDKKISKEVMQWSFFKAHILSQRYGHQSVLLSSNNILMSGGFGQLNKRHQRMSGLTLIDYEKDEAVYTSVNDPANLLGQRMFHTMTLLKNDSLVILGGRSSPCQIFEHDLFINHISSLQNHNSCLSVMQKSDTAQSDSLFLESKSKMLIPSWRHSASLVECDGVEKIIVFGGCTLQRKATNACQILDTQNWTWSQIPNQDDFPTPRHTHSSASYKANVIVTGGLSEDEVILNSVYIFEVNQTSWKCLNVAGLLPRYSHTSHVFKEKLILVGGIGSIPGTSLGLGVVDLVSLQALEVAMPAQNPEYPILLNNHTSHLSRNKIIVIGGGGNCFSFGTHFNKHVLQIELDFL